VKSALAFYATVRDLVLKGHSRNKALGILKKDLKSLTRIEAIAQMKEILPEKFAEVSCVL
jgi:hypothetical protein